MRFFTTPSQLAACLLLKRPTGRKNSFALKHKAVSQRSAKKRTGSAKERKRDRRKSY